MPRIGADPWEKAGPVIPTFVHGENDADTATAFLGGWGGRTSGPGAPIQPTNTLEK